MAPPRIPGVPHAGRVDAIVLGASADIYGARLGGIILSGANADGARGLAAVREAGGVTLVQSPESALVRTMPAAAMAYGAVDFVLPLEQMAARMKAWGGTGAV